MTNNDLSPSEKEKRVRALRLYALRARALADMASNDTLAHKLRAYALELEGEAVILEMAITISLSAMQISGEPAIPEALALELPNPKKTSI